MLYTPGLKRIKRPGRVVLRVRYVCPTCEEPFFQLASQRKGSVAYCSRKCAAEARRGEVAHNRGKKTVASKPCEHCGNPILGQPSLVAKRRFCTKKCAGAGMGGPNCPAWRGGSQTARSKLDHSPEYAAWRIAVRTRDHGRCRVCDSEGVRNYKNLETHHIVPVSTNLDLAIDVDNGITLCHDHHVETLGRENEQAAYFASLLNVPLVAPPAPNRKDNAPFTMTEQELRTQYLVNKRSMKEIGAEHGVTGACVQKYMSRWSIPARSSKEAWAIRKFQEERRVA